MNFWYPPWFKWTPYDNGDHENLDFFLNLYYLMNQDNSMFLTGIQTVLIKLCEITLRDNLVFCKFWRKIQLLLDPLRVGWVMVEPMTHETRRIVKLTTVLHQLTDKRHVEIETE